MNISNQLNNKYLKIRETRFTIFVTYSKKIILENILQNRSSFHHKFEKTCERFEKRKKYMQSLIEFQNNRRLQKKLKTAIESDEK